MTEFKHVTLEVTEFPNVKMNLEKSKLWISEDYNAWTKALNVLIAEKDHILSINPHRLKHVTFKFLLEDLIGFLQEQDFERIPEYFENLLEQIANENIVGLKKTYSKWEFSSTYLQILFQHLLDIDCILMPLVNARAKIDEGRPDWHPRAKPTRNNEPYVSIATEALETRNDKLLRGAIDTVFSSLKLESADSYTLDVHRELMKADFFTALPNNRLPNYLHVAKTIVKKSIHNFPTRRDHEFLEAELLKFGMKENKSNIEQYKHNKIEALFSDIIIAHPRSSPVVNEIITWMKTLTLQNFGPITRAIKLFLDWIVEHESYDLRNINRFMIIRGNKTKISQTLFEKIDTSFTSAYPKQETVRHIVDFFSYYTDKLADETGRFDYKSPVSERDKNRFPDAGKGSSRARGKSDKKVLPSHIIKLAKKILVDDKFAWSKSIKSNYYGSLFVPTASIALYTLLTLPVRTIQARLLDTGEFDEFILSEENHDIVNPDTDAIKNRRFGCLRSFREDFTDKKFTGFFITTNKSASDDAGRQVGYEIPYEEKKLIELIRYQIAWQKEHNPITVDRILDRSEIPEKGVMVHGNIPNLPKYALLFRDIQNRYNTAYPIPYDRLTSLWIRLLLEIEKRLADEGVYIKLTDGEEGKGGSIKSVKALYTLHGLRVSGITHFIEAGVPLHVLAEFVAGHSNLIMTLYYTKLSNWTISEQLEQAAAALDEASEDEFMKSLSELSENEFNSSFISGKEATAYLPDGDKGVWSVLNDGFCVTGQTKCSEGGTELDYETGIERTIPIVPNQFNCPLCKFYITGTAFLTNQVAMVNTLMCVINERAAVRNEILEQLKATKDSKNARKQKILQSDFEALELELTEKLKILGIRMTNVFKCQELLKKQSINGSNNTALITSMDAGELKVQLEETKQFELLEWASQSAEIFPNLPVSGAKFRKQRMLEKMAQENGLKPLFLHLSDEDAVQAGNQLTNMMTKMWGRSNVNDLLEGKQNLMQLGLMSDFETAVGEAIHSVVANTAIENPNTLMIEGGENIDAAE